MMVKDKWWWSLKIKDKLKSLKSRDWKALFKSVLSYMISVIILFSLPRDRLEDSDEHGNYFSKLQANQFLIQLPISVLLNDSSRSVGAMIQSSAFYFVSVMVTGLVCFLIVPSIIRSPFILLFFFFVSMFVINLLKASYPKQLTSTMNSAMLIVMSSVISAYYDQVNGKYDRASIASQVEVFILGGLVALFVGLFVFPRWAGDDLRKAIKEGIRSQGKLLAVMTQIVKSLHIQDNQTQYPLDTQTAPADDIPQKEKLLENLKNAILESRSSFSKITSLLAEARVEISYSTVDQTYYEAFTVIIRRLLRHLAAIGSSCESLLNVSNMNNFPNGKTQIPVFAQFMSDIHDDLMHFTDVCMMELRFIYNRFQSRNKQHHQQQHQNHYQNQHQNLNVRKQPDKNKYHDDDEEEGDLVEPNPWDNLEYKKHLKGPLVVSPWGSPGSASIQLSPEHELILPTPGAGSSQQATPKKKQKIVNFTKSLISVFGRKRHSPKSNQDEASTTSSRSFIRNALKIEKLFPQSMTSPVATSTVIPEHSDMQEFERLSNSVAANDSNSIKLEPLEGSSSHIRQEPFVIPETIGRIRSFSNNSKGNGKRNPDLRHSKNYSFTSSYIHRSESQSRNVSQSIRASFRSSLHNPNPNIHESSSRTTGLHAEPSMTYSSYPGWTLSDAIECIKQHQKQVVQAFIEESRNFNDPFTNSFNENEDKATISNVLQFEPASALATDAEPQDESNSIMDNLDDLYAIFSFLLCLCNFGDKLNMLGKRTRQMPNEKKIYIPFVWNDPKIGFNSRRGPKSETLNEEDLSLDAIGSMEAMETQAQQEKATVNFDRNFFSGGKDGLRLLLKKMQGRITTWLVLRFRSNEYKFAFRVATLVTFAAIFGFLEETRDLYHDWRGSWSLFTIAVVSSSTVGASTTLGFWRTIGTAFGGLVALVGWTLFPSMYSLVPHFIWALIISIPITYLRLFTKYQRLGLVTLVAFTIVFFGKYMQELDVVIGIHENAEPVFALFWKRTLSIVLGVAISLLGTICIFPTFARSVLRTRCARIIQRLCNLYANIAVAIISGIETSKSGKDVAINETSNDVTNEIRNDSHVNDVTESGGIAKPTNQVPSKSTLSIALKNFLALEFEIQMDLIESLDLIAPSSTEFSFEGVEFPASTYGQLLTQCQSILDGLLSNRLAAMIGFSDNFKGSVLSVAHHERKLVLASAILFFSVMHGSLSSKSALPPILPDIEKARYLLRRRLRGIPGLLERMLEHDDYHYLFVSACQRETVRRLQDTAGTLKQLFGVQDKQMKHLEKVQESILLKS